MLRTQLGILERNVAAPIEFKRYKGRGRITSRPKDMHIKKKFQYRPSHPDGLADERVEMFSKYEEISRVVDRKVSVQQLFGIGFKEKQKMKLFYGNMLEKEFKTYAVTANQHKGNKSAYLVRQLEMRADVLFYRAGFVPQIRGASRLIHVKELYRNGAPVERPRLTCKVGDILHVHPRAWKHLAALSMEVARMRLDHNGSAAWVESSAGMIPWLEINRDIMAAIVVREPRDDELMDLMHTHFLPLVTNARLRPDLVMEFYAAKKSFQLYRSRFHLSPYPDKFVYPGAS